MRRVEGKRLLASVALLTLLTIASAASAQESLVQIYLVRHAETEDTPADPSVIHLSNVGRQRVSLLAPTFAGVRVTHLFASHTARARETLEGIAAERSLPIVQLPRPGSVLKGQVITDQLSRREAIAPIAEALLALPAGSIAIVALNSENIFAVLNRLSVPVVDRCAVGQRCVPCLNNTCFPRDMFDRIWYVARRSDQREPLVFTEWRYGVGWSPMRAP